MFQKRKSRQSAGQTQNKLKWHRLARLPAILSSRLGLGFLKSVIEAEGRKMVVNGPYC